MPDVKYAVDTSAAERSYILLYCAYYVVGGYK